MSHLLQMRGLKRFVRLPLTMDARVASFTDAWIETMFAMMPLTCLKSHLLQMRGLKPRPRRKVSLWPWSHLLQMRGLKRYLACGEYGSKTSHLLQMRGLKLAQVARLFWMLGRIFYRCVDWNILRMLKRRKLNVASFTDAWIETFWL